MTWPARSQVWTKSEETRGSSPRRCVGCSTSGGPNFNFNEAVSFSIDCADQAEVDYYWDSLTDGGEPGPCGWLKDRYGLSWQVVPRDMPELVADPGEAGQRAMKAMMGMTKLDIAALKAAAAGS